MKIIFDLDGPILDVSERYYCIYASLSGKLGAKNTLSKVEYWDLKRKRIPSQTIMKLSQLPEESFEQYQKERLMIIEDERFLRLDRVYPFVPNVIKNLKKKPKYTL